MRPELPDDKRHRFIEDFGLSPYDAGILVAEREMAEFYEAVVGEGEGRRDPKLAANWVTSEFFGALNRGGASLEEAPVDALFNEPRHPYTQGLLKSMPGERAVGADRRLPTLPGSVPDPANPP